VFCDNGQGAMENFWLGVAAMAGLGGLILGLYTFMRSRSVVVMDVFEYPFQFPPAVKRLLAAQEVLDVFGVNSLQSDGSPTGDAQLASIKKFSAAVDTETSFSLQDLSSMWTVRIHNKGHELAENVELVLPNAKVIIWFRGEKEHISNDRRIAIGQLRPDERVSAVAWGRYPLMESPSLLQARGRASVRMHRFRERDSGFLDELNRSWLAVQITTMLLVTLLALMLFGAIKTYVSEHWHSSTSKDSAQVQTVPR
jgi:hypothetical protein